MQRIPRASTSLLPSTRRVSRRPFSSTFPTCEPAAVVSASSSTASPAPPEPIRERVVERIAKVERKSGSVSPFLTDSFGRKHDYLRISLTEKCNLRCTYCMPEAGVPLLPSSNLLTTPEIDRVARMFVKEGVTKIRLTGGEPTVRKDLLDVVERLGKLGLDSLGMTSNGIALKRKLPSLVQAGLTHLNISLDTLDPFKYELITRRRGFEAVMDALEVARGLKGEGLNTKINCVIIRGLNDSEIPAFVELTSHMDITVRFIEYMPFEDNKWSTQKLIPSQDLVEMIRETHPHLEKLVDPASDTTRSWRVPGYKGKIGFISSMSDHFCGGCSRLRVAANGSVKVCLFGPPVLALRPLLRSLPDHEILPHIGRAVLGKKFAHDGLGGASRRATPPLLRSSGRLPRIPMHLLSRLLSPSSIRYYSTPPRLTHIDPLTGKASMVSVSSKLDTLRSATAVGIVFLTPTAFDLITPPSSSSVAAMPTKKGDVLTIAQLAGIMGAKHTSTLIPLCHPLPLTHISVTLTPDWSNHSILVTATAECEGKTGVEMEALTGATVACLTVWDMCKAVAGREMEIGGIKVVAKSGGKSGDWLREDTKVVQTE